MIDIVLALVLGIGLGWFLQLSKQQRIRLEQTYTVVVLLLIFFMGVLIGANEQVVQNLPVYGGYALLFALCTISGSVLGVLVLRRKFQ
ncbi:MAG: LysO family transporter [Candidatus Woesearchaeota archaeon]|nr:LysO family transporter [Candidatus Woesearchaeota archaeon]